MIHTYIILIVIMILLSIFMSLIYEILSPFHEKIFVFFIKKGKKELKYLMGFIQNLGPNISAVSIVAIFIPIKGISVGILLIVFALDIISARVALYIENILK